MGTLFPASGSEAPETKGRETASLALSRFQKKGQTVILGYRLGKLRPRKMERRAQAPFQTGAHPDSLLDPGAGLSLRWVVIWLSGEMRSVVNRFEGKHKRPGLEFATSS